MIFVRLKELYHPTLNRHFPTYISHHLSRVIYRASEDAHRPLLLAKCCQLGLCSKLTRHRLSSGLMFSHVKKLDASQKPVNN
jgi:hypothetical protein